MLNQVRLFEYCCSLIITLQASVVCSQSIPSYADIKADERLQVSIAIKMPPQTNVADALELLQRSSKVPLSLAHQLDEGRIVLGAMSGKAPVWKIMQQIAATQFDDGRWVKLGDGYVLHGKPKVVLTPEGELKHLAEKKNLEKALAKREHILRQFPLRQDPKLQAKLSIVGDDIQLADLLGRLSRATKLHLTLADQLTDHDPTLGSIQFPNTSAWVIMEMIAQKDLNDGRWEKTPDGYRLEGTSRALRPAPPSPFPWGWTLTAFAGAAVTASGGFVLYRRRAKPAASAPNAG